MTSTAPAPTPITTLLCAIQFKAILSCGTSSPRAEEFDEVEKFRVGPEGKGWIRGMMTLAMLKLVGGFAWTGFFPGLLSNFCEKKRRGGFTALCRQGQVDFGKKKARGGLRCTRRMSLKDSREVEDSRLIKSRIAQ